MPRLKACSTAQPLGELLNRAALTTTFVSMTMRSELCVFIREDFRELFFGQAP